jgi:hypothetical protein
MQSSSSRSHDSSVSASGLDECIITTDSNTPSDGESSPRRNYRPRDHSNYPGRPSGRVRLHRRAGFYDYGDSDYEADYEVDYEDSDYGGSDYGDSDYRAFYSGDSYNKDSNNRNPHYGNFPGPPDYGSDESSGNITPFSF